MGQELSGGIDQPIWGYPYFWETPKLAYSVANHHPFIPNRLVELLSSYLLEPGGRSSIGSMVDGSEIWRSPVEVGNFYPIIYRVLFHTSQVVDVPWTVGAGVFIQYSWYNYLQGFIHPRYCRISSINSMFHYSYSQYFTILCSWLLMFVFTCRFMMVIILIIIDTMIIVVAIVINEVHRDSNQN